MPNHTELLDLLLLNRGISIGERERFLNPSYEEHLYDPFLMKDMERTVVRIFEAVEAKEKILIYSDYDCDPHSYNSGRGVLVVAHQNWRNLHSFPFFGGFLVG